MKVELKKKYSACFYVIVNFFIVNFYFFFQDGLTPLHCSARSGHEMVVDLLLERGAPKSSTTKVGNSIGLD
jgi:ankyrin repeat protein